MIHRIAAGPNDSSFRVDLDKLTKRFFAGKLRPGQVAQRQIDSLAFAGVDVEGVDAVFRQPDLIAVALENRPPQITQNSLVIDEQNKLVSVARLDGRRRGDLSGLR